VQIEPGDEPLTARERAAVIHRIRMLVEYWSITPEELAEEAPMAMAIEPAMLARAAVKYRHPRSGETWDGCGAHPQWLRDALLKEGFTVDQLRPPASAAGA